MRTALIWFAVLNATAAVTAVVSAGVAAGVHRTVVVSKYAELHVNGVLDEKALATLDGGRFAGGDWTRFPDWLNEGEGDWVAMAWAAAAVLMANGILFVTLWWRVGGRPIDRPVVQG